HMSLRAHVAGLRRAGRAGMRLGTAASLALAVVSGCAADRGAPVLDTTYEVPPKLDEGTVQRFDYSTPDGGDPAQHWADLYLPPGEQHVDSKGCRSQPYRIPGPSRAAHRTPARTPSARLAVAATAAVTAGQAAIPPRPGNSAAWESGRAKTGANQRR